MSHPESPKRQSAVASYRFDNLLINSASDLGIMDSLSHRYPDPLSRLRHQVLKTDLGVIINLASFGQSEVLAKMYRKQHEEQSRSLHRVNLDDKQIEDLLPRFFITAMAVKLIGESERYGESPAFSPLEKDVYRLLRERRVKGIHSEEILELIRPLLLQLKSELASALH